MGPAIKGKTLLQKGSKFFPFIAGLFMGIKSFSLTVGALSEGDVSPQRTNKKAQRLSHFYKGITKTRL